MRSGSQTLLLIIGASLVAVIGALNWMPSTFAVGETEDSPAILVDHNTVDAAQIPQVWLDAVRESDTFFAHRSVGNNILDGMSDLAAQDASRYSIPIASTGAVWFETNSGILHKALGTNTQPQTKIDGFDAFIRSEYHTADVAMMKFCPGDGIPFGTMEAEDIWTGYRDMMKTLEQAYPDVQFVWWTMPLFTAKDDRGNDQKEIFNALMRSYCDANSCVLFDIADIQSHDPAGNPVISAAGYEAMWNDYSYDSAHLNETGRVRVAAAYWWLLARIAGWEGSSDFSLSMTPETVDVMWGETAVYTVSIQGTGGFSQPVQLDTAGLPSGAAVTWGVNPLPPNQTTTLTVGVDETVSTGDYLFDIVGKAGTLTEETSAKLRVLDTPPEPGFSLSIVPEMVDVAWGETAVYTVSVQGTGEFSQPVQLKTTGLPSEATISWGANPLPADQSTTLTVNVDETVPIGDYLFTVVGTTDTLTKEVVATLSVRRHIFLPIILH